MTKRIYNFSSGPAVMPTEVLEKAQAEMLSLQGIGMSVMEISHRSKVFEKINNDAQQRFARFVGRLSGSVYAGRRDLAVYCPANEFSGKR
jgi:phosphoserine aminotransferase